MSYPPQGGGYQSGGDGYPDGNQPPPQQYDLYDQQTSGPGYQGGYQQQDPYGWGQAPQSPAGAYPPQSPAGGYPQQGYQPQPQAYPQQGQYQQPGFTPQPPPKKSNTGLIATVVIGSLALLLLVTGGLIILSRNGDTGGGTGDGTESSQGTQAEQASPKEVVQAYYDANEERDWQAALDLLSQQQYDKFKDVPDSERDAAADQLELSNTKYTVGEENIIDDETAEVDVQITSDQGNSDHVLTLILEDDEWLIDSFGS